MTIQVTRDDFESRLYYFVDTRIAQLEREIRQAMNEIELLRTVKHHEMLLSNLVERARYANDTVNICTLQRILAVRSPQRDQ